jgi:Flp pilus assembly protein TadG
MPKYRKKESGQALVEFTFMLPILLAVLIGVAVFAMLFYSYLTLQLAVREGTNAILDDPDKQTGPLIVTLVRARVFSMDPNQVNVVVVPSWDGTGIDPWARGVRVSVTATYTVPLPRFSIPMFGGGAVRFGPIPIQAESMMTVN